MEPSSPHVIMTPLHSFRNTCNALGADGSSVNAIASDELAKTTSTNGKISESKSCRFSRAMRSADSDKAILVLCSRAIRIDSSAADVLFSPELSR